VKTVRRSLRRGDRSGVWCIVLGRGEDDRKVREWLETAAPVAGFIGFALGRTTFWDPLVGWRTKKIIPDATVVEIACRYRAFMELIEKTSTLRKTTAQLSQKGEAMRVGVATDHGGFDLKQEFVAHLRAAGHEVIDFGAHQRDASDDYPDFVIPLAQAVAAGSVERGVAICASGVGASVCANKVPGIRASLIHDHYSAKQGVEDDDMNIICMGGRTVGPAVAWDVVEAFLAAKFTGADRHVRRLGKVAALESPGTSKRQGSAAAANAGED